MILVSQKRPTSVNTNTHLGPVDLPYLPEELQPLGTFGVHSIPHAQVLLSLFAKCFILISGVLKAEWRHKSENVPNRRPVVAVGI